MITISWHLLLFVIVIIVILIRLFTLEIGNFDFGGTIIGILYIVAVLILTAIYSGIFWW